MGKRGPKPGNPYKYTKAFIEKEADALFQYVQTCEMIPFLCEFAPQRGYFSARLSEWAKDNEKLSYALRRFKDIQEHKLLIFGLANKTNAAITALILKNNHDYREKSEVEHSGKVEGGETKIVIVRPDGKPDAKDERIKASIEDISG